MGYGNKRVWCTTNTDTPVVEKWADAELFLSEVVKDIIAELEGNNPGLRCVKVTLTPVHDRAEIVFTEPVQDEIGEFHTVTYSVYPY